MDNFIEPKIQEIIARATSEVAAAVRDGVREQVLAIISSIAVPGGLNSNRAPAQAAHAPQASHAAAAAPKGKPGRRTRGVDTADLDRLLEVIGQHPGLRAEQIYSHAGAAPKTAKKALKKLRAVGVVKTEGEKRSMTYSLASYEGGAPAAAHVTAPPKGNKPGRPAKAASAPAPASFSASGKKARSDRSYSEADINRVISLIQSRPGLRPSQYLAESKLKKNVFDRLVTGLKRGGRIRVVGAAQSTSYIVV